jgi:hypothetical protein
MTITDSNVLVRKIREEGVLHEDGKYYYSNKYFSICFDSLEFKNSPYGMKYYFYLEDSVGEKDP